MDRRKSTSFQPVEDWLRSLGLLQYAQSFYDNGYEDIETCKLIGKEDLDVIDVKIERDRFDILDAVNKLKQNLYFELEPETKDHEIERKKFEPIMLKSKLKECLKDHNVQLIEPPYYNPDGSLGDLYPLAIRFAEELQTFFSDVLEALDQLRKRQLPVQSYDAIAQISQAANEIDKMRSMTATDLPEYLDCETSIQKQRTYSFSKYDTRVTKSTTDLTQELQLGGKSKTTNRKIDRNKSLFGGVFKRKDGTKSLIRKSTYSTDFNATDVTFSQNEIVKIFAKVKNKEMSQEDAIAAIKKGGLGKSNSIGSDGNASSPESSQTTEKKGLQRKEGRLSKSMIKRTNPTAQFYTKDDDPHRSWTSLASSEGSSTLDRSNERSMSIHDIESPPGSSRSSPELGKTGILRSIRNSLRKKGRTDASTSDKSPSGSISSHENVPTNESQVKLVGFDGGCYTDLHQLKPILDTPREDSLKPARAAPPPPPPRPGGLSVDRSKTEVRIVSHSNNPSNTSSDDDTVFEERRPSLMIRSYEKYQEDITQRRSSEKLKLHNDVNCNITKKMPLDNALRASTRSPKKPLPPPRQPRETEKASDAVAPRPPPRSTTRSVSSDTSIGSTSIDEIGQDLQQIIAGLDDRLSCLNDSSDTQNQPIEIGIPKSSVTQHQPIKPIIPRRTIKKEMPEHMQSANVEFTNKNKPAISSGNTSFEVEMKATLLQRRDKIPVGDIELNTKLSPSTPQVKVSLKQILRKKLKKETIKLHEEPYTTPEGKWNIPYVLVERYSQELQQPINDVIDTFEDLRSIERVNRKSPIIPFTSDDLKKNVVVVADLSLDDWLYTIGLPMFCEDLNDVEITTVAEVSKLPIDTFKKIGVFDEKHVYTLLTKARQYVATNV